MSNKKAISAIELALMLGLILERNGFFMAALSRVDAQVPVYWRLDMTYSTTKSSKEEDKDPKLKRLTYLGTR